MPIESLQSWSRFILDWSEHWSLDLMKDPLHHVVFYALSRERWLTSPCRMACPMVDVGALGLDAKSATYDMGEVTGFNFQVQARLVQQAQLPDILRQAMIAVRDSWRRGEAAHYVFVCDHGTHIYRGRSGPPCWHSSCIAPPVGLIAGWPSFASLSRAERGSRVDFEIAIVAAR